MVTGVVVGGFGPIPDPGGRGTWWNATQGCLSVDYKWTTAAWDQALYYPLVTAAADLFSSGIGFDLSAKITDWTPSPSAGTFDPSYPVYDQGAVAWREVDTSPFTRAATENQWQTIEVRWKNGTTDNNLTSVASDGFLHVSVNGTPIYTIDNIALILNANTSFTPGGRPNLLRTVWLGYAGLFGASTNLTLTNQADDAPALTQDVAPPPDPPAGTTSYYHLDAIGSVRTITDQSAQTIARYDYLPFGEPWSVPAVQDQRQFARQERDQETSFDYVGARYYQSQTGRFTSPDPITADALRIVNPQRWNRYAHVVNNPLKYVDPDGLDALLINYTDGAHGFGHIGIMALNPNGSGLYGGFHPERGFAAAGTVKSMEFPAGSVAFDAGGRPTIGSLAALSEQLAKLDGKSPQAIRIRHIKTSEAETAALAAYIKQNIAAPSRYNALTNNCLDFCIQGLQQAGILVPPFERNHRWTDPRHLLPLIAARFGKSVSRATTPTGTESRHIVLHSRDRLQVSVMTRSSKAVLAIGLAYLAGIAMLYVIGNDGIAGAFLTLPASFLIAHVIDWVPPHSALEPVVLSWTGNLIALLVSAALNVIGVYIVIRLLSKA